MEIKTYSYPDGEIQRVQIFRPEGWDQLEFFRPEPAPDALDRFADIYRRHLVPACPWLFGKMVMFRLPADVQIPTETLSDRELAAAALLRKGLTLPGGKPVFRTEAAKALWQTLESKGCIRIVKGRLPFKQIIPVGDLSGYLTEGETAALKVNASFFIMDKFDCATVYDQIGTPLGLLVKDGVVENPPLFGREALLVRKDGTVRVQPVAVKTLEIRGIRYCVGENARLYSRPERSHTPLSKGKKLVIVGTKVVAVTQALSVAIPASGFVLEADCPAQPGDTVTYPGFEDIAFGIQVGNSILRNGEKTGKFLSRFYNIYHLQPVPFPPSLYPMDFQKSRAARIALGADGADQPVILWAEGAAKIGHTPGNDSRGATLADMAQFCADAGMVHAINLDGGGSAQMLVQGKRSLQLSDREEKTGAQVERPVPLALRIRHNGHTEQEETL